MRKQMKIAAVVSAAALLALGASITSFAASKGTWKYEGGEWYCYDKNGDVYSNTFCLSNGKEFYVGDNGEMVTSSWVEYDGEYYFVNSSGQKVINDWRLTTPYDDDSADEEWFYFQSTGKMAKTKKLTIKGKTYFFDGDGKMLTGWVTADGTSTVDEASGFDSGKTYYCDETGARLEKAWVKTTEAGTDEDETDADEYYYYLKSSGKAAVGKLANIKGQTYFFDKDGKMLTGWVAGSGSNYSCIQGTDEDEDSFSTLSAETTLGNNVYYCGDVDDGHMKKNKWLKAWNTEFAYDQDEDEDKFWFWVAKDGKVYVPTATDAAKSATADRYKLEDGKLIKDKSNFQVTKKKVNSKDYFFDQNGQMVFKFINVTSSSSDLKSGVYYFGGENDGAMKSGAQTVKDNNDDSYKFYFETKGDNKGQGITGNKSGKLYYMGQLVTADDYRYEVAEVGNYTFIVNKNGSIQHSKVEYKEDGTVLVNAKDAEFDTTAGAWKDSVVDPSKLADTNNTNTIDVDDEYGLK